MEASCSATRAICSLTFPKKPAFLSSPSSSEMKMLWTKMSSYSSSMSAFAPSCFLRRIKASSQLQRLSRRASIYFGGLTIPSDPAESPKPCQITTGRRRGSELEARSELTFSKGLASLSSREVPEAGRADTEERRTRATEAESSMALRVAVAGEDPKRRDRGRSRRDR